MLKQEKKGIFLIATGHPYYGKMAYNLALTIKAVSPETLVHVCHGGMALSHLSADQRAIFDNIERMPADLPASVGAKVHMYELSPFEETLYLDVDMAWLPQQNPNDLFAEMKDVEFTSITEGVFDISTGANNPHKKYYYWADPVDICKAYNLTTGKIYQWRSEVIYFKRSEKIAAFFADCEKVYKSPGIEKIIHFSGGVPDELAINIAAAIHNIHPHKYKWSPAYWSSMHGDHIDSLEDLYGNYYALSCGSNVSSSNTKRLYDRIVKVACNKFHKQHLFPLVNKRDAMKDRSKM